MKKTKRRTMADCMAETRQKYPHLTRAVRREVARCLMVLNGLEVLREKIGDKAVDELLAKAAVKIRERIKQNSGRRTS